MSDKNDDNFNKKTTNYKHKVVSVVFTIHRGN